MNERKLGSCTRDEAVFNGRAQSESVHASRGCAGVGQRRKTARGGPARADDPRTDGQGAERVMREQCVACPRQERARALVLQTRCDVPLKGHWAGGGHGAQGRGWPRRWDAACVQGPVGRRQHRVLLQRYDFQSRSLRPGRAPAF
jgi:hypothetical protein